MRSPSTGYHFVHGDHAWFDDLLWSRSMRLMGLPDRGSGQGGTMVALDFPLCNFEICFVATSSPDAFGADAVAASVVQAAPLPVVNRP